MDQQQSLQGQHGELVELHISCRGLKNLNNVYLSDPQVYVYSGTKNQPVLIGHTEVIKHNLNPDFTTRIKLTYHFNKVQDLLIYVYDANESIVGKLTELVTTGDRKENFMGSCSTQLSKLMGAPKCISKLDLKRDHQSEGKVIVFIDKVREESERATTINWRWGAIKLKDVDWLSKSDPFAKFFREDVPGQRLLVHQTNVIDNNLNPQWNPWVTSTDELCPKRDSFYVEVWDYNKIGGHEFIGSTDLSLQSIIDTTTYEFKLLTKHNHDAGRLVIMNKTVTKPQPIHHEITFLDYLRGGWQLSLVAGIDFTFSNGPINKPDSLHKISEKKDELNYYQKTIAQLGGTIISYDYDKQIPVFGFGGIPKLPGYTKTYSDDCFPIAGNKENPFCNDVGGILKAYIDAVPHVDFSGPTFISAILRYALTQGTKNAQQNIYTLTLIMTDGQIEDMNDAMAIIAQLSLLPMSIIIVGVGDEDFSYMHILDNVEEIKKHAKEDIKAKVRDVVQFVAYKEFKNDSDQLCAKVLDNFPKQFMEYMKLHSIEPNELQQVILSQLDVL